MVVRALIRQTVAYAAIAGSTIDIGLYVAHAGAGLRVTSREAADRARAAHTRLRNKRARSLAWPFYWAVGN